LPKLKSFLPLQAIDVIFMWTLQQANVVLILLSSRISRISIFLDDYMQRILKTKDLCLHAENVPGIERQISSEYGQFRLRANVTSQPIIALHGSGQ